jgi:thymidylate synthase (FAD)
MRHRTWSYNEISRRYTDKDMQFYYPAFFRTQHKSNRQASNQNANINPEIYGTTGSDFIKDHCQASLEAYNDLLSKGVCREQARMILPQNLYTEYYGTTNLSNLYKFVHLRLHEGAQWEIQQVAKACLSFAEYLWPTPTTHFKEKNNLNYNFKNDWKIQSTGT